MSELVTTNASGTALSALALTLAKIFATEVVLTEGPKIITALEADIANENPIKILKNEELALLLKLAEEVYTACGGVLPIPPVETV